MQQIAEIENQAKGNAEFVEDSDEAGSSARKRNEEAPEKKEPRMLKLKSKKWIQR
jgi:hypothetical protein